MASNANNSKAKLSVNDLLKKVGQYRSFLEDLKKRHNEALELAKALTEKNANLVKENATVRQSLATSNASILALKDELCSLKVSAALITRDYENYKAETEKKLRMYEDERQLNGVGQPVFVGMNIEGIAQRVCAAVAMQIQNGLVDVVSNELRGHLCVENADRSYVFSPPRKSRRENVDVPDSLKRFVSRAGHPRAASTPVRSAVVSAAVDQIDHPDIAMTTEINPVVMPRVVVRPKQQHSPLMAAIVEEDENRVAGSHFDDGYEEEFSHALPPLKPKPSRSAPVRGSKTKSVAVKPKARSRCKMSTAKSSSSLSSSSSSSSFSNNDNSRISTKVHKGRVESRVANAILLEAENEKRSRSKPLDDVTIKKVPSVFDLSFPENGYDEQVATTAPVSKEATSSNVKKTQTIQADINVANISFQENGYDELVATTAPVSKAEKSSNPKNIQPQHSKSSGVPKRHFFIPEAKEVKTSVDNPTDAAVVEEELAEAALNAPITPVVATERLNVLAPLPSAENESSAQPMSLSPVANGKQPVDQVAVPEESRSKRKRKQKDQAKHSKKGRTLSSESSSDENSQNCHAAPALNSESRISSSSCSTRQSAQSDHENSIKSRNPSPSVNKSPTVETTRRARRTKAVVSYAEPPLNVKMRRHFDKETNQLIQTLSR